MNTMTKPSEINAVSQAAAVAAADLPDYDAIKTKQQATWGSGDYGRIGVTLQITGEQLCEAMDLRSGQSVLDVAGGNGNATLAAARRFCNVVSSDYVASLLAQSRVRAEAEGLDIDYREADAENLPFADARFDNVISTFGVMFTPNQPRAAAELLRVCRPGGRIGMANWTPEGFIGRLFKTIGHYLPPPKGVNSPAAWGTEAFLQAQFGPHAQRIEAVKRQFVFRYRSPAHWLDLFRTYYGPTLKAFQALDETAAASLAEDILRLIDEYNLARDGSMVVPSDYLEVVITR
jgi:ubiquinone/menaquinone biosynthesis C-methylase UbiE